MNMTSVPNSLPSEASSILARPVCSCTDGNLRGSGSVLLRRLTNSQLRDQGDRAARAEHAAGLQVLDILLELDRRRLYLELGYSSLFDYCTRRWLFSRSKAGRVIAVARTTLRYPELRRLLERRELTVGNAASLVGVLTPENSDQVLTRVAGLTYIEIEEVAARYKPARKIRDVVRPIGTHRGKLDVVDNDKADETSRDVEAWRTAELSTRQTTELPAEQMAEQPAEQTGAQPAAEPANGTMAETDGEPNAASRGEVSGGLATGAPGNGVGGSPAIDSLARARAGASGGGTVDLGGLRVDPVAEADTVNRDGTGGEMPAGTSSAGESNGPTDPQCGTQYEVHFSAGPEFASKLARVRAVIPGRASLEGVFELLLDEFLERHDPMLREIRRCQRPATATQHRARQLARQSDEGRREVGTTVSGRLRSDHDRTPGRGRGRGRDRDRDRGGASQPEDRADGQDSKRRLSRSRHIPARTRDLVFLRDHGRCTYVGPEGVRCSATLHLQVDHVKPFALGGNHSIGNLRLLCGQHNRLEAKRLLGT